MDSRVQRYAENPASLQERDCSYSAKGGAIRAVQLPVCWGPACECLGLALHARQERLQPGLRAASGLHNSVPAR